MPSPTLKPLETALAQARRFYEYYKMRKMIAGLPAKIELSKEALALYRRGRKEKLGRIWIFPPLRVQKASFKAILRMAGDINDWSSTEHWPRAKPYVDPRFPWAVTRNRPRGPYALMLHEGDMPKWTRVRANELLLKLRRRHYTSMTVYEYLMLSQLYYAIFKDHRWDGGVYTWQWLLDSQIEQGVLNGNFAYSKRQHFIYGIKEKVANDRRGAYPTIVVPLGASEGPIEGN